MNPCIEKKYRVSPSFIFGQFAHPRCIALLILLTKVPFPGSSREVIAVKSDSKASDDEPLLCASVFSVSLIAQDVDEREA